MRLIGVDIGGTKCVVSLGQTDGQGGVRVLEKGQRRATDARGPWEVIPELVADARVFLERSEEKPAAVGISCGGPLDSKRGLVLSPPNLIGWDHVEITAYFEKELGIPAFLCNDANACALVEWRMGAGKGCKNMAFMTFGTGLGAGLILNGRLYEGTTDSAGEVGHIRLSSFGPVGYGKAGSFEGFCSGGGIVQLAQMLIREELQQGRHPELCPTMGELDSLTAEKVARAAQTGDPLSKHIMTQCGHMLGVGLSIMIDILNPEKIVIGSVFARARDQLWPAAQEVIEREALAVTRNACQVVPWGLAESAGDLAALMVAAYHMELREKGEE